MNEIRFKRDTAFRKQFFVPDSFAHPAKCDAQLLLWIVERYTEVGETILDPMFGSGTTMLACIIGRNVIGVELEQKFIDMAKANWEQVKMRPQLGSAMGNCQIIQGDARQLEGVLGCKGSYYADEVYHNGQAERSYGGIAPSPSSLIDKIVTSPPYAEAQIGDTRKTFNPTIQGIDKDGKRRGGSLVEKFKGEIDKCIFSPPYAETLQGSGADAARKRISEGKYKGLRPDVWTSKGNVAGSTFGDGYSRDPENLSNLPYGNIDSIITSPPYEATVDGKGEGPLVTSKKNPSYKPMPRGYSVDSIITSPPYEEAMGDKHFSPKADVLRAEKSLSGDLYANERQQETQNIGNLKSTSYLEAMLQVYQQCHSVLRDGGLMILVTKNFIRQKQVIRLDEDTIKLCEQAGFSFVERHYRRLPAQSFWRIIYAQKHPEVEQILFEDVLCFLSKK